MMDIPLPRLLNPSGVYIRRIRPLKVSIEEHIVPLSSASIQLPEDESLPARYFVELFTPNGSAGIYRIRSPQNAYGEDISVAELEHAIVEVGDYLVREKISEMMTPQAAFQRLFSHYRGNRWQLGNVSALGNSQIAVQVNYDNILTGMISLLDQVPSCYMTFDFSTTPWTVGAASRGTTVTAEGRLSRNVQSAKITYDDSELCTRGYYEYQTTDSEGNPTTAWASIEADTISQYGVVEREIPVGAGAGAAEALRTGQEYIRKHKKPRVSIEIGGQELSAITGEQFDTFKIAKLFRLAMVDYDVTIDDVITGWIWDDVYGKPTEVTVQLADEEDSTVVYIHDIESSGGRSGGGGGSKKQQEDTWKEYFTRFQQTDHFIDQMAVHVNEAGDILQQAGMYIDSNGVLQYAQDNARNIGAKLKVEADRIGLVVEGTGTNAHIKPAEIVAAINNGASTIKISADHIVLDGDAIASSLESKDMMVASLTAANLEATEDISCLADLTVGGDLQVNGYGMGVSDVYVSGNTLHIVYADGRQEATFSKAVSLSGEWSGTVSAGKSYKVTPSAGSVHYSPQIESIYRYAPVTWANDRKSFSVKLRTQDVNGEDLIEEEISFDTSASYTAGANSVTTIRPTDLAVSNYMSGTNLGNLSGVGSGKWVSLKVGTTTYSFMCL